MHSNPSGQVFPQAPQFCGSVCVLTQLAPHCVAAPAHPVVEQAPSWQTAPGPHFVPQAPQWLGSIAVSTQAVPQSFWPGGHAQLPETQLVPLVQTAPHAPQWESSLFRSTHEPLQSVSPAEQDAAHAPLLHTGAAPEQAVPQPPQFFGSADTFVQTSPHRRVPAGHTQAPPLHVSLARQLVPHAPQLDAWLDVSTHAFAQSDRSALHAAAQVPLLHFGVSPPHVAPQEPQLRGSDRSVAHAPAQLTSPGRRHVPLAVPSSAPESDAAPSSMVAWPPQAAIHVPAMTAARATIWDTRRPIMGHSR
jgi:hypothetical protein